MKTYCYGILLTASLLGAAAAHGQTPAQRVTTTMLIPRDREIELALSAAPSEVARDASVYVFTVKGYELAKTGSNGFTCLVNRDSFLDGYEVLKPTCWDAHGSSTIVPALLAIEKLRAAGKARTEIIRAIRELRTDGQLKPFAQPGITYMLAGDISEYDSATGKILARAFPPHVMLYASGISEQDLGLAMKDAIGNPRAPLLYESASGYRYIVVRVP